MSGKNGLIAGCCLAGVLTPLARGADILVVPTGASGSHTIAGNDITLDSAGQRVFFEFRVSGWDPGMTGTPKLKTYQVVLDSSGYASSGRGRLTPALEACFGFCNGGINNGLVCIADADCNTCVGGSNDGLACEIGDDCPDGRCEGDCNMSDNPEGDRLCRAEFGGACGGVTTTPGAACVSNDDCPDVFPPIFVGICEGSQCGYPTGVGGFCEPGFILVNLAEYVFILVDDIPAVDLSGLNFRYASAVQTDPVADPGGERYLGTLVLDVPLNAVGTLTVGLQGLPDTILQDPNDAFILPLNLTPARVIIPCSTDADCDDANACTDDSCRAGGTCLNVNNFDDVNFCCKPADRTLTPIDDLNECTEDACDALTGDVSHDPFPSGTACGDPADTECDNPDTCDGAGTCRQNTEPIGTSCGDPNDTDCDNPDTCDGVGGCLANPEPNGSAPAGLCGDGNDCTKDNCLSGACSNPNEPSGSACGDATDTDCDDPDTCNGAGACLANNEPDGPAPAGLCGDGNDCTQDNCLAAVCANPNEPPGTGCGDPTDTDCDDPDTCDGAGLCLANNEPDGAAPAGLCDDGNDCTQNNCLGAVCTNPNESVGTACGDPADTQCDNPDTCDGAGICQGNLEPPATPCGDPADTECTDPDTCDGAGACLPNHEPDGSAPSGLCGDGNECTQDNCLLGACANPSEPAGTACGDPADTDCDNPDTCNGAGGCSTNNEPDGPAPPGLCGDANDCTQDNCLAAVCANPNEAPGTDCGDPTDTDCDNPDTCDGVGGCSTNNEPDGPAPVGLCGDSNDCTQDNCLAAVCANPDESLGTACGYPSDTECTDADTCDGAGACLDNHTTVGTLCGDPNDDDCDNPDTCDGSGTCVPNLEPDGTLCDDGLFCNVDETCTAGACGSGAERDCSDGIGCTDDTCDEITDACVSVENDAHCDNLQFCDGLEICDNLLDCIVMPGSVPDCNDLVGCTEDSCDEVNDRCVNATNDATCDNGQFCDGVEICDPVLDCIVMPGSVPDPDDGVNCTDDSCDEVNDVIVNTPNNTLCPDDGLFCNGGEFCNPIADCDHTGSPCGGPCDEVTDTCLCEAPDVVAVGQRYLRIAVQPPDSGPQAIVITPDCAGGIPLSRVVCPPRPFDIDGDGLEDENVAQTGVLWCGPADLFRTPEEWGELYVFGDDIVPNTTYVVQGDCGSPGNPGLSDPTLVTTPIFGDTVGVFERGSWTPPDGESTIFDIIGIINEIRGLPTAPPISQVDLIGVSADGIECLPDQEVGFVFDLILAVDAFRGFSYEQSTGCRKPCR